METSLDRGGFLVSARKITGENHALKVDTGPRRDRLVEDIDILDDFAGKPIADALVHLGFLVAGPTNEIEAILECCRGAAYLCANTDVPHARAVIVSCSLFHWVCLCTRFCSNETPSGIRRFFSDIMRALLARGFHESFREYRKRDLQDGTILLLPAK